MPDMNRNVANPAGEDDLLATRHPAPRPGQDHFIADTDETGLGAVDAVADESAPSSMWGEAWRHLRRRPLFWVSALLILVAVLMAVVPQLFTSVDPRACTLSNSLGGPQAGHPFGFDRQGCDIYSRTIYGARASVSVGLLTTALVVVIGTFIGAIAGYFGGILDTLLSRVTDIFFAIPLVLAAIVVMQMFKDHRTIITVVLVLGLFGWTNIARITRGAVMGVKNEEYVTAARALGASRFKILASHIMPNAAAPIIVYAQWRWAPSSSRRPPCRSWASACHRRSSAGAGTSPPRRPRCAPPRWSCSTRLWRSRSPS